MDINLSARSDCSGNVTSSSGTLNGEVCSKSKENFFFFVGMVLGEETFFGIVNDDYLDDEEKKSWVGRREECKVHSSRKQFHFIMNLTTISW